MLPVPGGRAGGWQGWVGEQVGCQALPKVQELQQGAGVGLRISLHPYTSGFALSQFCGSYHGSYLIPCRQTLCRQTLCG